jgi:hypothetical protein
MKIIIGVACCLFSLCLVGTQGRAPLQVEKQKTETFSPEARALLDLNTLDLMPSTQADKPRTEKFGALAYLPSGAGMRMVGAGATANVDLYIKRYTPDHEAKTLGGLLLEGGPDQLLKVLEKADSIGKITLTGRVGFYDLKLIRSRPTPTGRRIIAVGDRPIGFLEAYVSNRSRDYQFGILQLDLKRDSKGKEKGQGVLVYAAKVKVLNGKKLEIENYGIDPIRLMGVRKL